MVSTESSGRPSLEPGNEGVARDARVDRAATERNRHSRIAIRPRPTRTSRRQTTTRRAQRATRKHRRETSARPIRIRRPLTATVPEVTSTIPPGKRPTQGPAANGNGPRRIARPPKATAPEPLRIELQQPPGAMRRRRRVTTRLDYATPMQNAWNRRSSRLTSRWHKGSSS